MSENYMRRRFEILGAGAALCWVLQECEKHPDVKCGEVKVKVEKMVNKIRKALGEDFEKNLDLWLHNVQAGK